MGGGNYDRGDGKNEQRIVVITDNRSNDDGSIIYGHHIGPVTGPICIAFALEIGRASCRERV